MKKENSLKKINSYVIKFLTVMFIVRFLILAGGAVQGADFLKKEYYVMTLIVNVLIIIAPLILYLFYNNIDYRKVRKMFRINPIGFTDIFFVIAMFAFSVPVVRMLNSILNFVFQFMGYVRNEFVPTPQSPFEYLPAILIIIVVPSVCEELFFRGFMLKSYEEIGLLNAVLVTSIFYGISFFDINRLPGQVFLSILLSISVLKTDSIFSAILGHMSFAFFSSLSIWNETRRWGIQDRVDLTTAGFVYMLLFGMACLIVVYLIFVVFMRSNSAVYLKVDNFIRKGAEKIKEKTTRDIVISIEDMKPLDISDMFQGADNRYFGVGQAVQRSAYSKRGDRLIGRNSRREYENRIVTERFNKSIKGKRVKDERIRSEMPGEEEIIERIEWYFMDESFLKDEGIIEKKRKMNVDIDFIFNDKGILFVLGLYGVFLFCDIGMMIAMK